ncbi:MAG: hypothetical protein DPW11_00780 [bacterium]|nr:glycosyltransferase [Candidatus Microgenomates bacterium CPR3]MCQ3944302.1 hypothetical protein [bacterium]RIK51828.1 MAG: hypothetical protein DCC61_01245 [Candidatus Microgenomates bacterium]
MSKKLSLTIVIPCWNSAELLQKNLSSVIKAAKAASAKIIIIDDQSSDNSIEYLKSLKADFTLLTNPQNLGFGETVNRGVAAADSDLVVLLNTDVRPELDCFLNAMRYFEDPKVFAVGFNSNEGSMRVNWEKGLFHHFRGEGSEISLWASGGQAVFDRKKYLELGGMDPMYKPFYWEDTDLGYNAWKRGWKVVWGQDCHCVHDHQSSVIKGNFTKDFIYTTAQRNQFLFIWKNISDPSLLISHFFYLPLYLARYPKVVIQALQQLPIALRSRYKNKRYWKRRDQDILRLWK